MSSVGAHREALVRLHELMTRINAGQDLDAVLQAIVDGVVEMTGFEVATINVLQPDGDFRLVAVAGGDEDLEALKGEHYPAHMLLSRLGLGAQWGLLRFVSHEIADSQSRGGSWVPTFEQIDHPDAWHPNDELAVPLHAPTGELLGIMYFDQPHDRLRPGPETRGLLEMYAVQAGIALNHAQQRERLREQMWLAGMVHSVVETTDGRVDLDQCLDSALSTLRIELGAVAAWLDIFPGDEPPVEGRCPSRSPVHKVMAAVGAHGPSLARDCLRRGEALVLDRVGLAEGHRLFTSAQATTLLGAMEAEGVQSLVLTPLPANEDVAGQLVLMRSSPHPWTPAERVAVRDMGRELGWTIDRDRGRRREARAHDELVRAERDRHELLSALADEVVGPVATIDGHLHDSGLPEDHPAQVAMDAFWGVFDQVTRLVSFEDPRRTPRFGAVDVANLLLAQWPRLNELATEVGVRLLPLETDGRQMAWADSEELDWLLGLMLADLVQAASPGASIRVSVGTPVDRLLISFQISPTDDPEPMRPDAPRWWRSGAHLVLAPQNGSLAERTGPGGRRAMSISLPVPPAVRRDAPAG
jgi:GAF domain-containing protein